MATSKPIQEQIYKSRLTITYRTTITGTLQQEILPFRVLVLGEFAGKSLRSAGLLDTLRKRTVRSIKRGTTVNDHLREMLPVWKIPQNDKRNLHSRIAGEVRFKSITATLPPGITSNAPQKLQLSGKAHFISSRTKNGFSDFNDNEEIELTGDAEFDGAKFKKASLRFRGVATGDCLDPVTRKPVGKIAGMPDGNIGGNDGIDLSAWEVPDEAIGADKPVEVTMAPPAGMPVSPVVLSRALPICSMSSFAPDEIVNNVPEIQRKSVLKKLLARLQSDLRNYPELRTGLKGLLPGPSDAKDAAAAKIAALKELQAWAAGALPLVALSPPQPPTAPATLQEASEGVKRLQDSLVKPIHATNFDLYTKDATQAPTNEPWAIVRWSDDQGSSFKFDDRNPHLNEGAWLMNALAVVLLNADATAKEIRRVDGSLEPQVGDWALDLCLGSYPRFLRAATTLAKLVDDQIRYDLDSIYHDRDFQALEAAWRGLDDLARSVESPDVQIDFLDVEKEELRSDLIDHDLDMFSGAIFDKVYVGEYDRYGGKPFATMIGLYEFTASKEDVAMLRAMGRVANASHCPFIAAADPKFFDPYTTMAEVAEVSDLDAILSAPQFGKWQELRDTEYAAYLGLTIPRYLVRKPWKVEALGNDLGYRESVPFSTAALQTNDKRSLLITDDTESKADSLKDNLLWGNAAILFAKNMIASYQSSGWAQHLRGPIGGGLCEGLVSYQYTRNGYEEIQPPVEIVIPDYRELQFATNGFIPLVHKKGEAVATFFSSQSIKKPKRFVEDLSTKNAALVTNLAYTFSITRIAHFVKRMMREYIGAAADEVYIQQVLSSWLGQYVTLVTNPDDVTLRSYPFKAATVSVEKNPGPLGWYRAIIQVLPHVQFEGMDVELRLEAALGGP